MKRLGVFLSLAMAMVFAWGSLNWTGFCFSEFRYVPKDEFVERFLDSNPGFLKPELWKVRNQLNDNTIRAVMPYANARDYLRQYPGCCSVGPQPGVSPDSSRSPPTLWQRVSGMAWGQVAVRLHTRYIDRQGQTQDDQEYLQFKADSCGKALNPNDGY